MNQSCFAHYHNESFFGLAKEDCRLVRKNQGNWSAPSNANVRNNRRYVQQLQSHEDRER